MPEHLNATRERLRQARDAFRGSLNNAQPGTPAGNQSQAAAPAPSAQPAPSVSVAAPAQPVTQPTPVQASVELKRPDEITSASGFDTAFSALAGEPATPSAPASTEGESALRSAQEENAALRKEIDDLRKQRESDQASLAEYNKLKEQQEIDNYLSGTEKLNTIDADDARKLLSPLIKTIKSEQASTQERFRKEREALDQRFNELTQRERELTRRKAYDTILKAYPDMAEIQRNKAYQDVMSSPIAPGSDILVGTMVARDLQLGKTDYVMNVLKTIKDRMAVPDLTAVASVGSSSTPAAPAPDKSSDLLTPEQLADLKFAFQNRQITREQYHERLAKHREASRLRS